jgi:GNAT superfamily N-acetyltransferase
MHEPKSTKMKNKLSFSPLTPDRWNDFKDLFGKKGACGGCWCMYWRLKRAEFNQKKGDGNQRMMQRLVKDGNSPGILAYSGSLAVGWCAIAPRSAYPVLNNSRILSPVDDQPVWSIVCFYIRKEFRNQGISVELIRAAVEFAGKHKAKIVEAYPVEPKKGIMPAVFAYTGLASAFRKAGFMEVARRSETRPIMRLTLTGRGRGVLTGSA